MIPAEERTGRTGTLYVRLTAAPRLPRDTFGRRSSPAGRVLLGAAAQAAGLRERPERLPDGRWHWPDSGWRGSVSHTGALGLAALARDTWVGADVQEHRDRPAALRWLARVLGRPPGSVATLREWAEVEALLKARGTAGVRPERLEPLPAWRPGWRDAGDGWWLWSGSLAGVQVGAPVGAKVDAPVGSQADAPAGTQVGSPAGSRPSRSSRPETYVALAARVPLDIRPLPPDGPGEHPAFPVDAGEEHPAIPADAGDPALPADAGGEPPAPESLTRTKGTQR
ncbi:hypothetical protein [Streptomyces huiliensis]|uniref:hypothetical protein n=1 Tax=Streptomyces huiliensis TaxID=2876027 RepID=UPI001CBCAAFE|nr:hypothetical protein [Streptomyces huiliensis]MBZ4319783.1 hypothetical protein [Streptomyces huiliensis]